MKHRIDARAVEQISSRIGSGVRLSGTLRFKSSMKIQGDFEGEIISEGFLYVQSGATVRANIKAERVLIGGTIHGNLEVRGEVEMLTGCVVKGTVKAGKVRIEDGVVFDGKCVMLRNRESLDILSAPLNQLRNQALPAIEQMESSIYADVQNLDSH